MTPNSDPPDDLDELITHHLKRNFYLQLVLLPLAIAGFFFFLKALGLPSGPVLTLGKVSVLIAVLIISYRGFLEAATGPKYLLRAFALALVGAVLAPLFLLGTDLSIPAVAITGFVAFFLLGLGFVRINVPDIARGRHLWTRQKAAFFAHTLRSREDNGIFWGGVRLPFKAVGTHFSITGAPETGKTLLLRLFMQEQLGRRIDCENFDRALVYDPKGDAMPLLRGMRIPSNLIINCNPYDKRAHAWDIAADVTNHDQAEEVAQILIPREPQERPFWNKGPRDILASVMEAFIQNAGTTWTLRDVVTTMLSKTRIQQVLRSYVDGFDTLEAYVGGDPRTWDNVFTTIRTAIRPFRTPAALMHRAYHEHHPLSLRQWKRLPYVLVFGRPQEPTSSLAALNRCMVKLLSNDLLRDSEIDQDRLLTERRTWFFFDELASAGELPGLFELLQLGRSKGVTAVVGFQSIEDLRAHYNGPMADALFAQIAQKAFLRIESPITLNWAEQILGVTEWHGRTPRTVDQRLTVLGTQLMQIKPTNPRNGLTGYYKSAHIPGIWKAKLTGRFLSRHLKPPHPDVPGFDPRPDSDAQLPPWTDQDNNRLGITPKTPSEREEQKRDDAFERQQPTKDDKGLYEIRPEDFL